MTLSPSRVIVWTVRNLKSKDINVIVNTPLELSLWIYLPSRNARVLLGFLISNGKDLECQLAFKIANLEMDAGQENGGQDVEELAEPGEELVVHVGGGLPEVHHQALVPDVLSHRKENHHGRNLS